ncbi:hypothetical protein C5E45_30130 [Nocardia nova]|uniref:Uncharacterized protein n=1 Tax=Nocardia nova TaxID=37330 RepID=A0A2S6AHC8_9NOCA|nr:hypothetical protein [Nocardia nova]PPJ31545.1 hypothetical protein C5E41_06355 [Nocardia nova]PPJ34614.1 hypothetical protein C5E45_30130 [Nocardia nova]
MTRELPFDDDADAGDHANDAAYRVATGVARVARAGAYVTGGALIASNGSPAPENESHNSHITGWSTADPHPDVPSPVVTYPDLSPDSVPPDLGTSAPHPPAALAPGLALPEQRGTDAYPGLQLPFADGGRPVPGIGGLPISPDGGSTAPPFSIPGSPSHPGNPYSGNGGFSNPGFGGGQGFTIPGTHHASAPAGFGLPGAPESETSGGFGVPGQPDASGAFGLPGAEDAVDQRQADVDTTGADPYPTAPLPGHGLGLPGTNGLHLPGMNGFGPGGFGGLSDPHPGAFDGVGDGGNPGVFLGTEMKIDAHVGFDGIWVTTETKVDFSVGDVGHQLDDYGQWLGSGTHQIPGGATESDASGWTGQFGGPASSPHASGSAADGVAPDAAVASPGAATHAGAANGPAGAAVNGPAAAAANGPGAAVPGSAAFAPQSGPIATSAAPGPAPFATAQTSAPVTNVAAPQPVSTAPVIATPVPATPAPAPALVQPVSATPLQTTIQPEAATHPIANVITTHAGPSPLTAPAVAVPALFDDRPRHAGTDAGLPGGAGDPSESGAGRTTTSHGATATHGADATKTPAAPSTSHTPGTTPGDEHTTTRPGTSTGRDSADHDSIDRPTPTVTVPRDTDSGHPTRTPGSTPSDTDSGSGPSTSAGADASTPGHTATHTPGTSSGSDTAANGNADDPTAPARGSQLPTHDQDSAPTQQVPTQQVPTQHVTPPSHDQAVPTHEPTVPTAQHTAPVEPPTVIKPPTTIDPAPNAHIPVKPVAAVNDSYDTSLWTDPGHGLTSVSAAGLSGGLYETTFAEMHHPVDHPVVDFHVLPL